MGLAAKSFVFSRLGRLMAPRAKLTVSEWADRYRVLTSKGSSEPGQWRTSRNPLLKEPMDALSATSPVESVVLRWPIQSGKSECAINWIGYVMCHMPGPMMVCLPGEVSMNKWSQQKLEPALAASEAMREPLTSVASRETANQKNFKDFAGGQLYLEHAGSPARLKSTSVRFLIVDEVDEFATSLTSQDNPLALLQGRTSAFPGISKKLFISTPTIVDTSKIDELFEAGSQAQYHFACPDCGHEQPFEWDGLSWDTNATKCWYSCRECGVVIEEHQKSALIRNGRWVHKYPERKSWSFSSNALYYSIGLGPRWIELVREWKDAQGDPGKIKTFKNDRMGLSWEDPLRRSMRDDMLRDRARDYVLRVAPSGVLAITAGVDTQDDRLEVHIKGWGRGMRSWTLDYVRLNGDPANDATWVALTDLLNRPILHESGTLLPIEATAIDAGGHRTEYVKNYARKHLVRRVMAIFGAKPINAPILSRGKLVDVQFNGQLDKRGVMIYHVGTVAAKNWIYGRIGTDADREPEERLMNFSDQLPNEFFQGMVSEIWDPRKNRFVNRKGARNEPLDTTVYAYAAAHHPELRLNRWNESDWAARERYILERAAHAGNATTQPAQVPSRIATKQTPKRTGLAGKEWSIE